MEFGDGLLDTGTADSTPFDAGSTMSRALPNLLNANITPNSLNGPALLPSELPSGLYNAVFR